MGANCAAFGCLNSRKNNLGLRFNRIPTVDAQTKLLRQR